MSFDLTGERDPTPWGVKRAAAIPCLIMQESQHKNWYRFGGVGQFGTAIHDLPVSARLPFALSHGSGSPSIIEEAMLLWILTV